MIDINETPQFDLPTSAEDLEKMLLEMSAEGPPLAQSASTPNITQQPQPLDLTTTPPPPTPRSRATPTRPRPDPTSADQPAPLTPDRKDLLDAAAAASARQKQALAPANLPVTQATTLSELWKALSPEVRDAAYQMLRTARRRGKEAAMNEQLSDLGAATARVLTLEAQIKIATEEREEAIRERREADAAAADKISAAARKAAFDVATAGQLGDELKALKDKARDREAEMDAKIATLNKEHDAAIAALRKQINASDARAAALSRELDDMKSSGASEQRAREVLADELTALRTDAKRNAELLERRSQELREQGTLQRGVSTALAEMAEQLERLKAQDRKGEDMQQRLQAEEARRLEAVEAQGRLEATIAARERHIADLEREVTEAANKGDKKADAVRETIEKRDAQIKKWGDVYSVVGSILTIFKDPTLLVDSTIRTSVMTLVDGPLKLFGQLLSNPDAVYSMPDPDEKLAEVRGIYRDLSKALDIEEAPAAALEPEQSSLALAIEPVPEGAHDKDATVPTTDAPPSADVLSDSAQSNYRSPENVEQASPAPTADAAGSVPGAGTQNLAKTVVNWFTRARKA